MKCKEERTTKKLNERLCFCVLIAYIILGLALFKDYNISTDEPNERETMYVNLNYVLTHLGREAMEVQELDTYSEKYYGIFCQMPTAIFEIGHKGLQYIYYGRHLYTFLFCLLGYLAFFFVCKRLFGSYLMGMLGAIMVAFYPRFFAEQFYNIKDMFFVSIFMISMWITVKLIDSNFSWGGVLAFSFIVAVATNVRIVGIIFLILLIGYIWIALILSRVTETVEHNLNFRKCIGLTVALCLLYWGFLVLITPITWQAPVRNIIEMFAEFMDYDNWSGAIIFAGRNWGKDELPWYYVPGWMLVSVPIWYLLFIIFTVAICLKKFIVIIKMKRKIILEAAFRHKYLIWCLCLVGIPWLGIVINHATLYGGWRHCYFMLPPLILFSLHGIDYLRRKGNAAKYVGRIFILLGFCIQAIWIIRNHPHEMVYFNNVGKQWAAGFDRDYWHMGELQAYQYIAANDKSEKLTINTSGTKSFINLLDENEKNRIEITDQPLYYIETYRGKIGNEFEMEGYEEFYSIIIDGFKVTTVMKKTNNSL